MGKSVTIATNILAILCILSYGNNIMVVTIAIISFAII